MQLINHLNRPEYIFNPIKIYHRLYHPLNKPSHEFETVKLPWGVEIKIRPNEVIGRSIWIMGIYDLSISELIWRLVEPGETTIDVGANIGYITSILANKVGKKGQVISFEPLPEIYAELLENIQTWQKELGWHQIITKQIALSNKSGQGMLKLPNNFTENRGTASLASETGSLDEQLEKKDLQSYLVPLTTLDEFIDNKAQIGLIKIDVEGHEFEVLQGADRLITQQQIRDIVFEEHHSYPTPVTQFLEDRGYTIFRIKKGFWKPLLEPSTKQSTPHPWEPPNYLATKEPSRAIQRMKNKGWSILFNRKSSQ
ncbi:FkbM family methyltransferase [Phormidium sp. LEGE 05292]|uniref:FkbM family methyltransferase n=1 Tax=[Phormidium] sp. LEGE 05292 TaxID=767427 RepID=UPI00187F170F|nr:FkbM family methyltransferase [Phormidium sp. LEGE 05292]MBE9224274.1 FkbM family methyltransferase [Phormidium sp. LEGE 05292]